MALDDPLGPCEQFDEKTIKDPEKIRKKFKQKTKPEVLYEEGVKEKVKVVGSDDLTPNHVYVWFVNKKQWEDPEILQNALFCSRAVYEGNPLQYLKGGSCKKFHTINHFLAFGDYKSDESSSQRCLVVLSKNPKTEERMLIVAFKGTELEEREDWLTNLKLDQEPDTSFRGKFHSGFLGRARNISIEDIVSCAEEFEVTKIQHTSR